MNNIQYENGLIFDILKPWLYQILTKNLNEFFWSNPSLDVYWIEGSLHTLAIDIGVNYDWTSAYLLGFVGKK